MMPLGQPEDKGQKKLMGDLEHKPLIVLKGILFLLIAAAASAMVFLESPSLKTAALLLVVAWASARFYYFLFYALERYVDPSLRYAGLAAMIREMFRKRGSPAD